MPVQRSGQPGLITTLGANVAISGNEVSDWFEVTGIEEIRLGRTATGGTYVCEVDWSRDGTNVDWVETVTVPEKGSAAIKPPAPWMRLRVRNTSTTAAFTAHRTNAMGFAR